MKKICSSFIFVLYVCVLLLYASSSAYAIEESVEAFENKVRTTWHNSGDRVAALRAEKAKIVGQEDNYATLYGVKKSDIYTLLSTIDIVISNYIQIKEEVKNSTINVVPIFGIDKASRNMSEDDKLKLYFGFLEANADFSDLLKDAIDEKTNIQKINDTYEKELLGLENAYRVTGEAANYDSTQYTKESFDFNMAKLYLEDFLLLSHFGELHRSTLDRTIKGYERTLAKIKSLAKGILKEINIETLDTSILDQRINNIVSYYIDVYDSLRDDTFLGITKEELALLPKEFSQLLQNTAQTEQKYVLSIYQQWNEILPIWYTLMDIISGDKPISTTENIQEYIDYFNQHANNILQNRLTDFYAVVAKIGEEPVDKAFLTDPRYAQLTLKLKRISTDLNQRYLTYVKLHNRLQDEFSMMEITIQALHNKAGDKAVKKSLRQKHFNDLLHWELFNIAHRPITVGKIGRTLLIIIYAYLIVFLIKIVIRKLLSRSLRKENDSYLAEKNLIMEKTTAIIVYILAFLCILTELNIPLTAFAYMGGIGAVAIGFGAQTIFANLFSGLILIYGNKVRVKDWVIVDDTLGRVENITAQNTIIAYDCFNQHMVVPNSLMLKDTVRNVTRADGLVGDSFEVVIEDVHDLNRGIAAIYRKKDSIKELLPNYFFAAWSGEISGVAKLRPSIIVSYTYDVRLMTAGRFKAIMRNAVYDALIEEGIYDPKKDEE
ncbi:MAG: mechanosensitive ion channel family protein [Synergistaceae bacterium]|nr:mechanosensitive ion channel family protein [Synergistaceae bacterium]